MKGVTLRLLEYEENRPDHGDYLHFFTEVVSGKFFGQSEFWVARSDLDRFLRELQEFSMQLSGEVSLTCGWGDETAFSISFSPYDQLGHIRVRTEVAADERDTRARLLVELKTEPSLVQNFLNTLHQTIHSREDSIVYLEVSS